jgi:nitrate/nitrite transporter NarK
MTSTSPTEQPTGYRYGVLGFCCALSMITYLDRVCFSNVAGHIQSEFGLNDEQKGYLFGAFTFAYACFEVPSGWLGDRFGPRRTLIRIVLWWSTFTALTAAVQPGWSALQFGSMTLSLSFLAMLAVRFFFGVGEAGAYPNIARAFHNWFPYQERGFAKGTVWMAGRFAGGVTPFIVYAMINEQPGQDAEWRHTFWIFGALGAVWCVLFYFWFRDHPEQKTGVNAAEIAHIHGGVPPHHDKLRVPWGKLITSPNLWLICLMYFASSYGWYFNITYLPGFLEEQFGLHRGEKWSGTWWSFSIMAGLPLLFGSAACLVGGLMTDAFIRRTGNRKWGRRLFGILGHGLCAACYFGSLVVLLVYPSHESRTQIVAWMFVFAVAMASFCNDMTMGAAWASCLDIGGRVSGIVAGCMNTVGNLGGFTANIVTGFIIQHYVGDHRRGTPEYFDASQPAWAVNLFVFGLVYLIAVAMWMGFDATKQLMPPDGPPHKDGLLPGVDPVTSFKADDADD